MKPPPKGTPPPPPPARAAGPVELVHPCESLLKECAQKTDWASVSESLEIDRSVGEVEWCEPGPAAALKAVDDFCARRLSLFADKRNDPNVEARAFLSCLF